jgi:hypothetical protein
MRWRQLVGMLVFAAGLVALSYSVWASQTGAADGLTNRRIIIPGIATDSVPPPAAASGASYVWVDIEMTRSEPALTGSGTTKIQVRWSAELPLPAPGGPAALVSAPLSIGTHPADKCIWDVQGSSGSLVVTYSRLPASPMRFNLGTASDISWYYMVQCPGSPPPAPIRFPAAPTDESFTGWLGLILQGTAGPGGVTIEAPVVMDPSGVYFGKCLGELSNTNEFGTVQIIVVVTDASCTLPTPTPGPTVSPYEPGLP